MLSIFCFTLKCPKKSLHISVLSGREESENTWPNDEDGSICASFWRTDVRLIRQIYILDRDMGHYTTASSGRRVVGIDRKARDGSALNGEVQARRHGQETQKHSLSRG